MVVDAANLITGGLLQVVEALTLGAYTCTHIEDLLLLIC